MCSDFNRNLSQHFAARDWIYEIETLRPYYFPICRVEILLLTEGSLDFSTAGTGLSSVVAALASAPFGPHIWPRVTTAHRSRFVTDIAAGKDNPNIARFIKGFRFDDPSHFAPGMYDQVWLFGRDSSNGSGDNPSGWSNTLAEKELRLLAEFMTASGGFAGREPGGVFATGDHGSIGAGLCGFVPRVRTMRRWFEGTGPFGSPAAPGMRDPERNDTNRNPTDPSLPTMVDTQQDEVPQGIEPKYYYRLRSRWASTRYPHPLLCGRSGAITVLPDHPHEGECRLPYETDRTLSFDGASFVEWPVPLAGPAGTRLMPEIIAESTVIAGTISGAKDPAASQRFGAICAYDVDKTGVGRVVTDATWHHFVNMNVWGFPGFPGSISDSTSVYGKVTDYWRNIAKWLSPPGKRRCVRRAALWYTAWNDLLVETIGDGNIIHVEKAPIKIIHELGHLTRLVIARDFGPCDELLFTLPLPERVVIPELAWPFDPWVPAVIPRPRPGPDPLPWLDTEAILDIAMGGAMAALREAFPVADPAIRDKALEAMDGIMERGAAIALSRAAPGMEQEAKRMTSIARGLRGAKR